MKKKFLVFLLYLFSISFLFAQQVMIPHEIYIADTAIIQYTFMADMDFDLSGDKVLPLTEEELCLYPSQCTVSNVHFTKKDRQCTLSLELTPWKTGFIYFKEIVLSDYLFESEQDKEIICYTIQLQNITVSSLAEKMEETVLRPLDSPKLLPGTKYFILLLVIGAIIFIAGIVFLLVRIPEIKTYFKQRIEIYRNLKNYRSAVSKLNFLLKQKMDDSDFAEKWQVIVRNYLDYRFSTSFASITASKISLKIYEVTGGMMPDNIESQIENLVSIFIRTNYIRFAKGSVDSIETQASFNSSEREELIRKTEKIISVLEKGIDDND